MSECYPYAVVEIALAATLGVPEDARGALRGRIKRLQGLGLAAETPGKGKRIEYSRDAIDKWAIALRLGGFGLDPTAVAEFIQRAWEAGEYPLKDDCAKARAARPGDEGFLTIDFRFWPPSGFPQIGYIRPFRKPHPKYDAETGFFQGSQDTLADRMVIPLTALLRKLDAELEAAAALKTIETP